MGTLILLYIVIGIITTGIVLKHLTPKEREDWTLTMTLACFLISPLVAVLLTLALVIDFVGFIRSK